jgi:hypothetical protein
MDSEVHNLLMLLVVQFIVYCALEAMSGADGVIEVWRWHQIRSMNLALRILKKMHERRPRRLWAHERCLRKSEFFYQNLFGSFNAREFKMRLRVDVSTFEFLCSSLVPLL